jgi:hypothetical protein
MFHDLRNEGGSWSIVTLITSWMVWWMQDEIEVSKRLVITPTIIDGMYLIHYFVVVCMSLQLRNIVLDTFHMVHAID